MKDKNISTVDEEDEVLGIAPEAVDDGKDKRIKWVSEVVEDEDFDTIVKAPEEVEQKHTEVMEVVTDHESLVAGDAENEYRATELNRKAAPLIQDAVNTEVKKAVRLNNERLKLEVNEVLAGEVGYRLDKYEKRRKSRERKDFLFGALKWVLLLLVVGFILGNAQLRTRITIVARDFGELITGLLNNEEVSSNQLVEDMFGDLGEDLNEENTIIVEEQEQE